MIDLRWRSALVGLAFVAATTTSGRSALAQSEVPQPPEQAPSSPSQAIAEGSRPAPPVAPTTYVVQEKDTLFSIARQHGVSVDAVLRANNLADANVLRTGQRLTIPPSSGTLYAVQDGDTLEGVARAKDVSVSGIAAVNGIAEDATLRPGQQLLIPAPRSVDPLFSPAAPVSLVAAQAVPPTPIRSAAAPSPFGSTAVTITTRKLPTVVWPMSSRPSRARITNAFRPTPTPEEQERHDGVDIAAPEGTAIRAAAGGTVTRAQRGWNGGYGWLVIIEHGNDVSTRYAHMSELSVAVGERVQEGQKVGMVGSTGRSTGPHLHFELRLKSTPLDPLLALP